MTSDRFSIGSKIVATGRFSDSAWYNVGEMYTVSGYAFSLYDVNFLGYHVEEKSGYFVHDGFCELVVEEKMYPIGSTIVITKTNDGCAWYEHNQTFVVRESIEDGLGKRYLLEGIDDDCYVSHKNCRLLKDDEIDDWVNVKSKLPLENEWVIVWVEGESTGWSESAALNHKGVWISSNEYVVEFARHINVTHWKPKPQRPKELDRVCI